MARTVALYERRTPGGRDVRVVRSTRRRRTIEARLAAGAVEVHIPASYSRAEEDEAIATMVARLERRANLDDEALFARAQQLAARYSLPAPAAVTWSSRQQRRWGSCSPEARTIRLSAAMRTFPGWVTDYVLVHELAHLVHANHSAAFHELVDQYPKAERARGFLIAKGMGDDDEADDDTRNADDSLDDEPGGAHNGVGTRNADDSLDDTFMQSETRRGHTRSGLTHSGGAMQPELGEGVFS